MAHIYFPSPVDDQYEVGYLDIKKPAFAHKNNARACMYIWAMSSVSERGA